MEGKDTGFCFERPDWGCSEVTGYPAESEVLGSGEPLEEVFDTSLAIPDLTTIC